MKAEFISPNGGVTKDGRLIEAGTLSVAKCDEDGNPVGEWKTIEGHVSYEAGPFDVTEFKAAP